jgi:beta-fructofuranosidase
MYPGYGFRAYEIGDVDVIRHNGLYHLFHLTLPNHDYIAHAVSEDALRWRRVKNALFISDPKAWDDDMLWTMHVSPDPYRPGAWRMFYTGLGMREDGRVQRVGMARSDDLYHWHKDRSGNYPIEIPGSHYEHRLEEGRHWVSFRDPYCFQEDGQVHLIAAARINQGPVIRRGCVALAKETAEDQFEFASPLFQPGHYDDIEVPNLLKIDERYYLIGSIREDIKVHYWYADDFKGPYRNFSDNVLLPQGNYAARVSQDGDAWLVWNFFFKGLTTKGEHFLAPPKELVSDDHGELHLKSFAGFDKLASQTLTLAELAPIELLFDNPYASVTTTGSTCRCACDSGFEGFLLQGEYADCILSGELNLDGRGKCGFLFRLNDQGDGYYLSLDLFKGIAQIRAWGHRPKGDVEEAYLYDQLQANHYLSTTGSHPFRIVIHQQYLEFSLNGYVLLTLADNEFEQGRVGFYAENAELRFENLTLKLCDRPAAESYPRSMANY